MPEEVAAAARARAWLEARDPESRHRRQVSERPLGRPAEQAVDLGVATADAAQQAADACLGRRELGLEPGPFAGGDTRRRPRLRGVGTRRLERAPERVAAGRGFRPCGLGIDEARRRPDAFRAPLRFALPEVVDRPPDERGERDGEHRGRRGSQPPRPRQAHVPPATRSPDRKAKERPQAVGAPGCEVRAHRLRRPLVELARGVGRQDRAQLVVGHAAGAYRGPATDTRLRVRVFPRCEYTFSV